MEKLNFFTHLILPIIFILCGILAHLIVKLILASSKRFHFHKSRDEKRINTITHLISSIAKYVIIIIIVLLILRVYGVDIGAILAGIGIVGLVIGLAFQDIIKDFLAGIFIITDNEFSIGDTVEINGFKGEVIDLGLKTTRLKQAETGEIKIISNGNITEVTNFSISTSTAIVFVTVSTKESQDRVERLLNNLFKKLSEKIENLKGPITLLGITSFNELGVVYKITAKTKATKNYEVERQILKEVKKLFEKEQIQIPTMTNLEVKNGK